ncbi:MAG: helix-turn-helix domain-containing protein, partial [Clostridia bacterium]|nr:helix-turn-helix domain-containing protein [Clostridia bacterium]
MLSADEIMQLIQSLIWLLAGVGVKNVELANALEYSKPSVHNMLKSLAEMGIVSQKSFGLAHFTDDGREIAKKYRL